MLMRKLLNKTQMIIHPPLLHGLNSRCASALLLKSYCQANPLLLRICPNQTPMLFHYLCSMGPAVDAPVNLS